MQVFFDPPSSDDLQSRSASYGTEIFDGIASKCDDFQYQSSTEPVVDDTVGVTTEHLKAGLSQLGKTPDGYSEVYLQLSIPNAGLNDITGLEPFVYIQNLNLSGNQLTEISCLGAMRYLIKLDVSNNKLTEVLDFYPPPFNLQEIDFSRNQITDIADLCEHRFLKTINLDRNLIKEINGLSECRFLTSLSLAFNGIRNICNLDHLPIKYLDLRSNRLVSLEGIETLHDLQDLLLSNNAIQKLTSINTNQKYLRRLDLDHNQIDDPEQITHLQSTLRMLTELSFKRNPIVMPLPTPIPGVTQNADGGSDGPKAVLVSSTSTIANNNRLATAFQLQSLTVLDGRLLSVEEKVAAVNAYNPSPSVIASLQHSCLLKRQAKLYAKVKAEDLMRATYLRPIVLCGPSGAGKRTLTNRLLKDFPHIYGCSVSHTTRKPRIGEEQGTHYHFVSRAEMEAMVEEGKFAEVVTLFGCMYGTSMEAIDKVTEEGKVCIMDLEIEGVLALKRSHLKPIYIFITVPSLEVLKNRLENRLRPATAKHRGITGTEGQHHAPMSEEQFAEDVEKWMAKAPGMDSYDKMKDFFDLKIVNDDPDRAYAELRDFCLSTYIKCFNESE
ncbi:P-loop containing nucleoside triphosphate hydrolase protein [Obelidium mucronatum]|nr:P-loop containing nucleoside triphosphate hydrolase protein [Obelidium mucronatum]